MDNSTAFRASNLSDQLEYPGGGLPSRRASSSACCLLISPLKASQSLWIMPSGDLWGLPFETL